MRKKHSEHVNLERWLISYADFITLLFAFFVVMYALSEENKSKFEKVAVSVRAAFGSGPAGMIEVGANSGGPTLNPFENVDSASGRLMNMPAGKVNTAADPEPSLQEMKELLEESVSFEIGSTEVADHLQMQFDSRGLVVRISAKDFYNSGAIEPKVDLRPILDRIGRVISQTQHLVRFEGHADRAEQVPSGFVSHWEFSAARAAWVAQYWMKKFDLKPEQVGVAGYSYFRPLSEGSSPMDHAKNRRVEIIILNNHYTNPSPAFHQSGVPTKKSETIKSEAIKSEVKAKTKTHDPLATPQK